MDRKTDISENLRLLIEKHGDISLSEIARQTEIPQATLHNVLSGKTSNPRYSIKEKLSKFFGITVNQLTGREEISNKKLSIPHGYKKIPILGWHSSIEIDSIIVVDNDDLGYDIGILVDSSHYEPMFPCNSLLLCSQTIDYKKDKIQIVTVNGSKKQICTLINQDDLAIIIYKNSAGEKTSANFVNSQYDKIYVIKEIRYSLY